MRLEQLQNDEGETGFDSFYTSFGDLMVILCVFFLMLLSMSKIDVGSFEKIREVMTGKTENTLVELAETLEKIINTAPVITGASVVLASDGVRLDLDSGILFAPGKAGLRGEALVSIEPLLQEIMETEYRIDVEGHSDDVPFHRIQDGEVITNWSLSGKRASSVIVHLRSFGFPAGSLRAIGYADTRPLEEPKGKTGKELRNARARNRRVSLLIK